MSLEVLLGQRADTGISMRGNFILILGALFVAACSSDTSDTKKQHQLFHTFFSNQTIELFTKEHPNFKLTRGGEPKPTDIELAEYKLDEYVMPNGVEGVMLVTFFNNRLMQVLFYPADCSEYETSLAEYKNSVSKKEVEVTYGVDYKGICYASWEDKGLSSEFDYLAR